MVLRKMDSHRQQQQQQQQPSQPAYSMSPDEFERLVRETLKKVQLDKPAMPNSSSSSSSSLTATAPPTPHTLASWPRAEIKVVCQSSGIRVCDDCMQLTPARRCTMICRRHYAGLLETDCYFCGLASKPESFTKPFCDFLTENPTVFHAVDYFKTKLATAGFTEVGGVPGGYRDRLHTRQQLTSSLIASFPRATTGLTRSRPAANTTRPETAAA